MTKWLMVMILVTGCAAEVDYSEVASQPEDAASEESSDAGAPLHDRAVKVNPEGATNLVLGSPR